MKITAGLRGDPGILNGNISRSGAGRIYGVAEVEALLHRGLTIQDDQGQPQSDLADAVPTVENGLWKVFPDGAMETTWKIRRAATWHDGTPLTSADFLFTWQVIQDPAVPEFDDIAFRSVDSVEAPDAQTVVVKWKQPFIWANTLFAGTRGLPQPKHLLEQAFQGDKSIYTQLPYWSDGFMGTGPFKLREFARGSFIRLEAFDGYAPGRAKVDEIEVKLFQDANALAAAILAGLVDMTLEGQGTVSLEQALQVRDQWSSGRVIPVLAGAVGTFPQFLNPDPPVLLQAPFRRALLHATDRQALVDTLQAGISLVAHTHFQPSYPEYKDAEAEIVRYEFDARRAGQLVEGLGYVRAGDGSFRDGSGERLVVELRSTPGREVNEKITLAVADFWQTAGIGVNTVIMPLQRNQDREYRQTRPAFEVVGMPGDVYRLHSREIPLPENRFVGDNRARYSNSELDTLIDRYYVTIPRAERVSLFGQIMHLETDQAVQLPFLYEAGPLLVGNRIRNVTSVPVWNASKWEVAG